MKKQKKKAGKNMKRWTTNNTNAEKKRTRKLIMNGKNIKRRVFFFFVGKMRRPCWFSVSETRREAAREAKMKIFSALTRSGFSEPVCDLAPD